MFISRLSLILFDPRVPFIFQQMQFSLVISFAITINKSKGQSLKHIGIYLRQCVLTWTTISCSLKGHILEGLNILIVDDEGKNSNFMSNVVYKEMFQIIKLLGILLKQC